MMADTELRRRVVEEDKASESEAEKMPQPQASDTDDRATINDDIGQTIGQDKPPDALDQALSGLPPRWKNWVIRGIFTWLMIGGFVLIIYGGPLALMLTTFLVQVKVRAERLNLTIIDNSVVTSDNLVFSVSLRSSILATQFTRWTTYPGSDHSRGIFSLLPTTSSTEKPWWNSSESSSTRWTSCPSWSSITDLFLSPCTSWV